MTTYMCARTSNPNYWIKLMSGSTEIIADMPEETTTATGSEWESWFPAGDGGTVQNLLQLGTGSAARFQGMSNQSWSNSSPVEIPLELLFEATSDPMKEVYEPMRILEMWSMPSVSGMGILYAPGPAGLLKNIVGGSFEISLHIGNTVHIPSVILISVQSSFSSRLTAEGKPISGRSSITLRTSKTPAREDWSQWTGVNVPT